MTPIDKQIEELIKKRDEALVKVKDLRRGIIDDLNRLILILEGNDGSAH